MGEAGWKTAQAKVRHRHERRQVSKPGTVSAATASIGQGQRGVNSQRCQVGAGVLCWLVEQVKRPARGQGDPSSFFARLTTT